MKLSATQQRMLLVLLGGVALGCAYSPTQYYHTLRNIRKEWKRINQRSFVRSFKGLTRQRFVQEKHNPDGSITFYLTKAGKKKAGALYLFNTFSSLKTPKKWDKKWRIVLFDIPEKDRVFRGILRDHLRAIGFYKLQQSAFIFPYPCEKHLLKLAKLYRAMPYIRIITADTIDNPDKLLKHFFKTHQRNQ